MDIMMLANDAYRIAGNRMKSLEYGRMLIKYFPNTSIGYERTTEDLKALKRFMDAKKNIQLGIKITNDQKLIAIQEDLENDMRNIERLLSQQNTVKHNKFKEEGNQEKKYRRQKKNNEFCFLIRCKNYKDHKAQELAIILSKEINKKDIWFVHDSDLEDKQINVLSVKKFRQCMGLDWSIIAKKGWLLGDFAFYTAINCEIDYKYYYLIEDDVRFSGNALNIFLEETTKKSVDFLCPKYGERDQSSGWLMKFSYFSS